MWLKSIFGRRRSEWTRPGIQLERAMFCTQCEIISDLVIHKASAGGRCPLCGSRSILPLSRWIERPQLADHVVDSGRRK